MLGTRVISTGFNGTPEGFPNCSDSGCVRCRDSAMHREGRSAEASDPEHIPGRGLDRCICVHAEQNAIITAARFGIRVEGATLYTTLSPCFGCLKEAVQAGIGRVVYDEEYHAPMTGAVRRQYEDLARHLAGGDATRFERLAPETSG